MQVSNQHPTWNSILHDALPIFNTFNNAYGQYGYVVTLDSNETESGNDFANYRNGTKTGVKYKALNDTAERQTRNNLLWGWTIAAYEDKDKSGTLTVGDTLANSN